MRKTQREDAEMARKQQRDDVDATRAWLDKMLEMQQDVWKGNQSFLSTLLRQMETRQDIMQGEIKHLSDQLAINTSTVSEISKISELLDIVNEARNSPKK